MTCQDCKKREAQVHLTQIVNNEKMSLALCKECAAARGFHSPLDNVPFPLAEILSGLTTALPSTGSLQIETASLKCPNCGLTFTEFTSIGRFGCGGCYKAFRTRLEGIMRKVHGASLHRGTIPGLVDKTDSKNLPMPIKEEERLEAELKKAIDSEEFERAAEIRDKLKLVKQEVPEPNQSENSQVS
jgi:protein arginine kinase activator